MSSKVYEDRINPAYLPPDSLELAAEPLKQKSSEYGRSNPATKPVCEPAKRNQGSRARDVLINASRQIQRNKKVSIRELILSYHT